MDQDTGGYNFCVDLARGEGILFMDYDYREKREEF